MNNQKQTSHSVQDLPGVSGLSDVDAKIAAESIQQREFARLQAMSKRTPVQRAFDAMNDHRLITAGALVMFIAVIGIVPSVLRSGNTSDTASKANISTNSETDGVDTYVVDEEDYTDDAADTTANGVSDDQSDGSAIVQGSETNSGSSYTGNAAPSVLFTKLTVPVHIHLSTSSTALTIQWSAVPRATQYEVQISRSASMASARQLTSGAKQVVVVGLSSSTTYYVRVRAISPYTVSNWSAVVSAATKPAPQQPVSLPSVVQGVHGKVTSSHAVTLTWSRASYATRYIVIRAADPSLSTGKKEYGSVTGTNYTISDLTPGTVYYFGVRAANANGFGPVSPAVSYKTQLEQPSITNLSLLNTNDVRVGFSTSKGAGRYEVHVSPNANMAGGSTDTFAASPATVSGLKWSTKYYFQVRARDSTFVTAWSKARSMATGIQPRASITTTVSYQNLGRENVSPTNVFRMIKSSLGGRANVVYNFGEIDASDPYDEHGALKQVFGTTGWNWFSTDQPQLSRLSSDWKSGGTELVKLLDGGQVFRSHGCATGAEYLMISKYISKQNSNTKFALINTHFITHAYAASGNNSWCRGYWDRSWVKLKDKVASLHDRNFDVIIAGDFNHHSSSFPFLHVGTRLVMKYSVDTIFAIPAKGRALTVEGSGAISTPTGESFHKDIWARLKFSGK